MEGITALLRLLQEDLALQVKNWGFFNRIFSVLRSAVLKGNEGVLHCLTEASTSNNLSAANSTGKKAVTHTEVRD